MKAIDGLNSTYTDPVVYRLLEIAFFFEDSGGSSCRLFLVIIFFLLQKQSYLEGFVEVYVRC